MEIIRTTRHLFPDDEPSTRQLFVASPFFEVVIDGLREATGRAGSAGEREVYEHFNSGDHLMEYAKKSRYSGIALRGTPDALKPLGAVMISSIGEKRVFTRDMSINDYVHYAFGDGEYINTLYANLTPDAGLLDTITPAMAMVYDPELGEARHVYDIETYPS